MIFTLAFCLSLVAAGAAANSVGTNKEATNLDIRKMVDVNETLVVLMRKHSNQTKVRCQSAKKAQKENETQYQYTLRARVKGGAVPKYVENNVTVTLEKIGASENYSSTYTQDGIKYNLTLKQMESNGDCFVIFVHKSDGQQGCELIAPLSKLNNTLRECKKYYKERCNGTNFALYKPRKCNYK
uniref:Putative secreted protein n=1 Tax=Amblyomma cajennense TaxID=34607 RepID=A0A023FTV8_AMBCJ